MIGERLVSKLMRNTNELYVSLNNKNEIHSVCHDVNVGLSLVKRNITIDLPPIIELLESYGVMRFIKPY